MNMESSFENLYSLSDAAKKWHIEESTIRKAIANKKLIENNDVKKFGKQWVVRKEAMEREYGILENESAKEEISHIKNNDIIYFVFACFREYTRKYKISYKDANKDFRKYNIHEYMMQCYDYLHLQSINETVKDIRSRIKRGIRFI